MSWFEDYVPEHIPNYVLDLSDIQKELQGIKLEVIDDFEDEPIEEVKNGDSESSGDKTD